MMTFRRIYKIKHTVDGRIKKQKSCFMACGFPQREEDDYDETFSLVARYTSIRAIILLIL